LLRDDEHEPVSSSDNHGDRQTMIINDDQLSQLADQLYQKDRSSLSCENGLDGSTSDLRNNVVKLYDFSVKKLKRKALFYRVYSTVEVQGLPVVVKCKILRFVGVQGNNKCLC
jgi:hypothetical protein